jgi:hypothetical protein
MCLYIHLMSVTCDRLVVSSTNEIDRHDITEIFTWMPAKKKKFCLNIYQKIFQFKTIFKMKRVNCLFKLITQQKLMFWVDI